MQRLRFKTLTHAQGTSFNVCQLFAAAPPPPPVNKERRSKEKLTNGKNGCGLCSLRISHKNCKNRWRCICLCGMVTCTSYTSYCCGCVAELPGESGACLGSRNAMTANKNSTYSSFSSHQPAVFFFVFFFLKMRFISASLRPQRTIWTL